MAMISYDGRTFRSAAAETAGQDGRGPVGHYHQDGSTVWAEFAGGRVVRGSLAGHCDANGVLHLAYCQLLTDSSVVAGHCTSVPTVLADGRVRLHEHWERFGPQAGTGISVIEEPPTPAPGTAPPGTAQPKAAPATERRP
jgi:hypothetical protein